MNVKSKYKVLDINKFGIDLLDLENEMIVISEDTKLTKEIKKGDIIKAELESIDINNNSMVWFIKNFKTLEN